MITEKVRYQFFCYCNDNSKGCGGQQVTHTHLSVGQVAIEEKRGIVNIFKFFSIINI